MCQFVCVFFVLIFYNLFLWGGFVSLMQKKKKNPDGLWCQNVYLYYWSLPVSLSFVLWSFKIWYSVLFYFFPETTMFHKMNVFWYTVDDKLFKRSGIVIWDLQKRLKIKEEWLSHCWYDLIKITQSQDLRPIFDQYFSLG